MELLTIKCVSFHDEDIFSKVAVKALKVSGFPVLLLDAKPSFIVSSNRKKEAEQIIKVLNDAFVTEMQMHYVPLKRPYKNEFVFSKGLPYVCYISTEEDVCYVPETIHAICNGNNLLAKEVFGRLQGERLLDVLQEIWIEKRHLLVSGN